MKTFEFGYRQPCVENLGGLEQVVYTNQVHQYEAKDGLAAIKARETFLGEGAFELGGKIYGRREIPITFCEVFPEGSRGQTVIAGPGYTPKRARSVW